MSMPFTCALVSAAMALFLLLGVTDPVQVFNAPEVIHPLREGF